MLLGVYYRKNRAKHVRIMSATIAWDLILVLQIELSRQAIFKASRAVSNPAILNIHIALAVSTVVLYFVLIFLGRKLLQGDNSKRALHRKLGLLTVGLRLLTLITSFFAVQESL